MEVTVPNSYDYFSLAEINNKAIQPYFEIYSQEEMDAFSQSLLEDEKSISEAVKTHQVLCARVDSGVAGFIIFNEKHENIVWVSSLYVDPMYQRKSVGKTLIKAAEEFATTNELSVVAFETHPKAVWAKKFYEACFYQTLSENSADNPLETAALKFNKNRLIYFRIIKAV